MVRDKNFNIFFYGGHNSNIHIYQGVNQNFRGAMAPAGLLDPPLFVSIRRKRRQGKIKLIRLRAKDAFARLKGRCCCLVMISDYYLFQVSLIVDKN